MTQLPVECLYDIFEYLEENQVSLHPCLLVNRLWCDISVRILWRRIRDCNILIACLPNESKEILSKIGIVTPKFPMFNYATFCKLLSVKFLYNEISWFVKNQESTSPQNLDITVNTVMREIFKLLMNQIPSLKTLACQPSVSISRFTDFASFPGAYNCLKNL